MEPILKIKNLQKYYHDMNSEIEAIKNITLSIYDNEFISIVGPSGCGKSTLLSILANIETKSNGTISYKNKEIKVGYMLQKDSLFPWRTILENCLIGLEIENNLTKEKKDNVIHLLNKYGLKDFIHKYPSSLSGGMKQRVLRILYTHGIITYKWLITLINNGKEVYYVIR